MILSVNESNNNVVSYSNVIEENSNNVIGEQPTKKLLI